MSFVWSPEAPNEHDKTWDRYFMAIALLCEKRSKDADRQVGACVVNDEPRVIGTGYNGMPLDCRDRQMPWQGKNEDKKKLKHYYVCHAELNAIVNKDPKSVKGCTVYVTLFPCNECAKVLVRSGIKRVIYLSDEKRGREIFEAGRRILEKGKIEVKNFAEHYGGTVPVVRLKFRNELRRSNNGSQAATRTSTTSTVRKGIPWEQFFLGLAKISGDLRSVSTAKEGACVVNMDRRIVGLGYVDDSLFHKMEEDTETLVGGRELYVSHAPANAIVNQSLTSLRGCTMYVTHFPCSECTKVIVQSGIKKIVYMEPEDVEEFCSKQSKEKKEVFEATIKMLDLAHLEFEKYAAPDKHGEIQLDFTEIKPPERPVETG